MDVFLPSGYIFETVIDHSYCQSSVVRCFTGIMWDHVNCFHLFMGSFGTLILIRLDDLSLKLVSLTFIFKKLYFRNSSHCLAFTDGIQPKIIGIGYGLRLDRDKYATEAIESRTDVDTR